MAPNPIMLNQRSVSQATRKFSDSSHSAAFRRWLK